MKNNKKIDILLCIMVVIAIITVFMNSERLIQRAYIWYASDFVQFHSDFESGSIDHAELILANRSKTDTSSIWQLAYMITPKLDPENPVDTTLAPSNRWFYFKMTGVKDKFIHLIFEHTDPVRPVYSFDNISFERFTENESTYRRVSKRFTCDTVYIAYYVPYTFNYLQKRLLQWCASPYVQQLDTIGWSFQNCPLQMLVITDPAVPDTDKKRIYIHGRIHPSETPSSWHLDSMIEQLISDTPQMSSYCRQAVFYILPFANPDGVVEGLSRSNSQGINLEINYDRSDSLTACEVRAIKTQLEKLTVDRPLDIVLNMHSQTTPQMAYWIHTANSTSRSFYRQQLLLSNLMISHAPLFGKDDLLFSDLSPNCVEGWVWKYFKEKTMALCFETPYTFYNRNREGEWVSLDNLYTIGRATLESIADYYQWSVPKRIYVKPVPANKTEWKFSSSDDILFIGQGYYTANRIGARMKYKINNLSHGRYSVYKWNPGYTSEVNPNGLCEWIKMEEIIQKGNDLYEWEFTTDSIGAIENMLLIEPMPDEIKILRKAYPEQHINYRNGYIILKNGRRILFDDEKYKTHEELLNSADVEDIFSLPYFTGSLSLPIERNNDPGRYRNEQFLKGMYGENELEVRKTLKEIIWCPKLVNQKLKVTSINGVSKQLMKVSEELDNHPEWTEFLQSPGTYNWRVIDGTCRLSTHGFGIAIDINTKYSNYWRLDYPGVPEDSSIGYKNHIPQGIIDIFEKHGFIWGGKWYHYDTMHFEYRPELFLIPTDF